MHWNYILKLADVGMNNLRVLDRIFKWMVIIDKKKYGHHSTVVQLQKKINAKFTY